MFRDELFASVATEVLPGRPLIVDSFAGGGGASTGIEMALGRSPDIAINHNAAALALAWAIENHNEEARRKAEATMERIAVLRKARG